MLNRADPAATPRERLHGPETHRMDVTRGPAQGLAFALPWAAVLWALIVLVAVWLGA